MNTSNNNPLDDHPSIHNSDSASANDSIKIDGLTAVASTTTTPVMIENTSTLPIRSPMMIGSSIQATEASTVLKLMRGMNALLGCYTIFVGIMSWILGFATSVEQIIASVYIVLFGALLVAFEMRNEALDKTIQLNFGFMYGYKTRTIFLIFIAIWPLSMGGHWMTVLDAILLFLNAFFNLYVIYHHPAFSGRTPIIV